MFALILLQLVVQCVSASDWRDSLSKDNISMYLVLAAVAASAFFFCCCVLPKILKFVALTVIAGGSGFVIYKAVL